MTTFRTRKQSEESADESGGEETTVANRLSERPKAVPKRRLLPHQTTQQNGNGSLAAAAGAEEQSIGESHEEVETKKAVSNAGKLWADTAMMQTLQEKIASGSSSTLADLRDRGSETYAWDLGDKKLDLTKRKRHRPDDISDSLWDEPMGDMEEKNGKKKDNKNEEEVQASIAPVDPVAALWEGVDTGSVELPIEKQRNKWRQRNKYGGNSKRFKRDQQPSGSGQSTKVGSNKNSSVKNKKPKQFVPPEKFLPRRLLAANYDEEKLFSTQLDAENLDEEQLVQQMVAALGEKEPDIIRKMVSFAGKQTAMELFKECQEVEKAGGMMTKKGDRRKAPGGVLLQLFTQRKETTAEQKKEMFELGNQLMKKSGGSGIPNWWDKKKQRKQKQKEMAPPDIENDDLPKCSELLKPDTANNLAEEEELPPDPNVAS